MDRAALRHNYGNRRAACPNCYFAAVARTGAARVGAALRARVAAGGANSGADLNVNVTADK